jgi:pSer/pThr/pTyr-binding forkhead associated (FHA) protein
VVSLFQVPNPGIINIIEIKRIGAKRRAMQPSLLRISVLSGADDGKVFDFDKPCITIGRYPDNDVCLPHDKRVSRHHIKIIKTGEEYFLEDIGPDGKGSTNGTYIGNSKVNIRAAISFHELILIGSVLLRFELIAYHRE